MAPTHRQTCHVRQTLTLCQLESTWIKGMLDYSTLQYTTYSKVTSKKSGKAALGVQ